MSSLKRTGINAKLDRLVLIERLKIAAVAIGLVILLGAAVLLRQFFPETQSMLAYFAAIISLVLLSGLIVLIVGACVLGMYHGELKKTILSLFAGDLASGSLPDASFASAPAGESSCGDAGTDASDGGSC